MSVTLKLATSLDGRIATASGESRWITGEAAREQVHRIRAAHQAVLVGVETAIADDPELTVRLPGFTGFPPLRVVLDSRQRLPSETRLVRDAGRLPTVVVCCSPPKARLTDAGVIVLRVAARDGRVDPAAALHAINEHVADDLRRELRSMNLPASEAADVELDVLVEGGGQVAASFLAAGLVDRIEWFRAPIILGDEGRPAVGEVVLSRLADAPRFRRVSAEPMGDDLWERYEKA